MFDIEAMNQLEPKPPQNPSNKVKIFSRVALGRVWAWCVGPHLAVAVLGVGGLLSSRGFP